MKPSPALLTRSCLAFVLAGGRGTRLHELTDRDCKPAIPFAGSSRIVDFVLANVLNSGLRQALVATQFQPHRLISHIKNRWEPRFGNHEGKIACVGSGCEDEAGETAYKGTADAVYRNIARIDAIAPRHVLVLAADHVYQMDYRAMLEEHVASGADVTIAAHIVPRKEATGFGVITADDTGRVIRFDEKPANPSPLPDDDGRAMASMGIYVFEWKLLRSLLVEDAREKASSRDFGNDLLPKLVEQGNAHVHRFSAPMPSKSGYWRDVGTIDALHASSMEILRDNCGLDMENWPLHAGWIGNRGEVAGNGDPCLIYPGSEAIGAYLDASVVGPLVSIAACARVERSVLMPGVKIGQHIHLRNAIVAPGVEIEGSLVAGVDPEEDALWFRRTSGGVLLIDQMMIDRRSFSRRMTRGWVKSSVTTTFGPSKSTGLKDLKGRSHELLTVSTIKHAG